MKQVTIFFDFEGNWGMPYKCKYDLVGTTHRLLDMLDKYNVKAVFFVVGKIIDEYPDLIKEIARNGHEIAIHGYVHEHLDKLTKNDLKKFSDNLTQIEYSLRKLAVKHPLGFRSPYLMAPRYFSIELYGVLVKHGYKWISNREIRYPEELFRPDRISCKADWLKNELIFRFILILLNARTILTDSISKGEGFNRIISNIKWLIGGTVPFIRYGLTEIPIYTPLDCDLLGLPKPLNDTPDIWIKYSVDCLISGLERNNNCYVLNFHDWIIGTSNRIIVLDEILKYLKSYNNVVFITSKQLLSIK